VFLPGPSAPVSYVRRGDRRIMVVPRAAPAIEGFHLLGVAAVLPVQLVAGPPRTGARALLVRLLVDALVDAGVLTDGRRHRQGTPTQRALATDWLLGRLDTSVAVPVHVACAALALDPTRLAAVVTRATLAAQRPGPAQRPSPSRPTSARRNRRVLLAAPPVSEATPRSVSLVSGSKKA
jgi:hypothetical protein